MERKIKAVVLLSLLSPFFAEVLSGSTPPAEIINPLSFLTLWGFYGAGVILVREFWIRYGKSVMSLGFLGFAYGIFEEGIFIKSWFDPHWPDLGILGIYREWGINVVWTVWLTIYHSMMSIWVPIMVFSLIFPDLYEKGLLGKKSIFALISIYIFIGLLFYFVLNPYNPPFFQYVLAILLALLFVHFSTKIKIRKKIAKYPFIIGILTSFLLFIVYGIIPRPSVPYPIPIILGIIIAFYFYYLQEGMGLREQHSLLLGFLVFWLIFFDFVLEWNGVVGEMVLGLTTFGVLSYLYIKRYKRALGFK